MPLLNSSKTMHQPPPINGKTQMKKTLFLSPESSQTIGEDRYIQDHKMYSIMKNFAKFTNFQEQSLGLIIPGGQELLGSRERKSTFSSGPIP